MKKRQILFVDDEPNVLQSIRRTMRSMRGQWEMHFAGSGKEALDLMADHPFNVIVSDMRMPEMDGAALLTEVKRRYPQMARIILSGYTDREMTIRSTGVAHQFIAKPCEHEAVQAAVQRACAVQDLFANPSLQRIVSQISTLPSVPVLYQKVIEELSHPDASINQVGEIVAQDTSMTARVLQLTNSAFFGLPRKISDPVEAARLLGIDTLKSLILATHLFQEFSDHQFRGFSMTAQWDHSLVTARYASLITNAAVDDKNIEGEAVVAGLLHDVGKLVFVQYLPDAYRKILDITVQTGASDWQAECEVLDASHAEVGAYLLGLWGLPSTIVEAVAFHHEPGHFEGQAFTLLTAVHVANVLAHESEADRGRDQANQIDEEYLTRIGMIDRLPQWRDICLGPQKENDAA